MYAANVYPTRRRGRGNRSNNGRPARAARTGQHQRLEAAALETLAWWLKGRPYAAYPRTICFATDRAQTYVEKYRSFGEG